MKKFNFLSVAKSVFTFIFLFAVAAACSNSASSEEEHPEPAGFVLELNGDLIVEKYPNQSLINNFPTLTAGVETAGIEVSFINEDKEMFTPDEPELYLDFEVSDPNVIEIEQHDGELWEFHINPLAEGNANLTLNLMHGDHPDFEGGPIEINVVAAE